MPNLTTCGACTKSVATDAEVCPHCGHNLVPEGEAQSAGWVFLVAVVILASIIPTLAIVVHYFVETNADTMPISNAAIALVLAFGAVALTYAPCAKGHRKKSAVLAGEMLIESGVLFTVASFLRFVTTNFEHWFRGDKGAMWQAIMFYTAAGFFVFATILAHVALVHLAKAVRNVP